MKKVVSQMNNEITQVVDLLEQAEDGVPIETALAGEMLATRPELTLPLTLSAAEALDRIWDECKRRKTITKDKI